MKTYAGIESEYAEYQTAKVVLIPVPYDGTSTWGKGADKGPDAFLDASENMEIYDIETQSEPYLNGIYLNERITENKSPEALTDAVDNTVADHLSKNKFVTLFGGEHSISIGSIRAFGKKYGKLNVLQLDAHTDLRPSYHGSACNHACAVYEANENHHLIQVGIRSMDTSEVQYVKENQIFYAHKIHENSNWIEDVLSSLEDLPTYITIDLDGFDPSILPATGTPEPGGLEWYPTLKLLKKVFEKHNVVGFDIVELCPNKYSKASDFLAAKLYYKMLAYKFIENK